MGDGHTAVLLTSAAAAVLLSLVSACLVATEIAVTRVGASGAGEHPDGSGRTAARLSAIAADPNRFLNLVLLLRVATEVAAIVAAGTLAVVLLGPGWPALLATAVVMIPVDYVLMGVTPRILGRQFSRPVAMGAVAVLAPVAPVLSPLSQGMVRLGRALTPRRKGERSGPFSSEEELRRLVDLAERGHVIDPAERQMIHSVFKLDDTVVREVMVPRTDIEFIDGDAGLDACLERALESGYSRLPITGENEDDVIGVLFLKDAALRMQRRWSGAGSGGDAPMPTAREIMRAASYVPDSKPIDELLRDMQRERSHVAVVIDEYGGTAGLVTIEDIVEEIVGEITDEYDVEAPPIDRLGDDRVRVTARLPLGELAEEFGTELDAPDVDTVGGLLAYALGRVPFIGAEADYAGLRLTGEGSGDRRRDRVDLVLVERLPEEPVSEQPAST